MKSKRIDRLLLYTALPVWAFSQIKGTIVDIHQQPVEGATIAMQLLDSTYLEAYHHLRPTVHLCLNRSRRVISLLSSTYFIRLDK